MSHNNKIGFIKPRTVFLKPPPKKYSSLRSARQNKPLSYAKNYIPENHITLDANSSILEIIQYFGK